VVESVDVDVEAETEEEAESNSNLQNLHNLTWLITGGTGSYGQAAAEIILRDYTPRSIRIYSRGEHRQVDMSRHFNDSRLRFLIGDVRDRSRLQRAMSGVDIVIHAAALKDIPTAEYNPVECSKTNIDGSCNVVEAAIDSGVQRVLAISTDKACQPNTLYGATKRVMESLIIQGNVYGNRAKQTGSSSRTMLSCVRYGNVLGSQSSIVPLFRQQLKQQGKITVTHPAMTRFWFTIEEGVQFSLRALSLMEGGEIFVPKLKAATVHAIVRAVQRETGDTLSDRPDSDYIITGIRPGEKMHETLISGDECRHTVVLDRMYVTLPEYHPWRAGDESSKWEKWESDRGKSKRTLQHAYSSDMAERYTAIELSALLSQVK
jgi:FlaA1/EpsC-like NDP-sugar epimerase